MSLRYGLLGLLADGPKTGYELTQVFARTLDYVWPASHSQIYPELGRLVEDGLIEQTAGGPRGSKRYGVSPAGLTALRAWLRDTEPVRRTRYEPMLRVFFLWLIEPAEAESYLRAERETYARQLETFDAYKLESEPTTAAERAARLALEGGIGVVRARLEWCDSAIGQVRSWAGGGDAATQRRRAAGEPSPSP